MVTSEVVREELNTGNYPNKDKIVGLLKDVPIVQNEPPIIDIVQAYLNHKVMPETPINDALHLALASYHKCDFLLTWNCKHLANANKFRHITRINTVLELYTPILTTPYQLLGGENNNGR